MIYGSVCSGIEAATVAWKPLGWKAAWYSEIEKFPCEVLEQRHPRVANLGDMTKLHETEEFNERTIELLVGGTPCQSFSIAGLRKGLADPRGNLALHFLSILERKRPRWVVWENVPGVLSSWSDEKAGGGDGGRWQSNDFDTFLAGLRELGYGLVWRILDAQFIGVPQRRRRVFVVGYFGDWRPAAAVLFERHSLSWDSPPSREKGEGFAPDVTPSLRASGTGSKDVGETTGQDPVVAAPLGAHSGSGYRQDLDNETYVPSTANTLTKRMHKGINTTVDEGQPPVVAFMGGQGSKAGSVAASDKTCPTLRSSDSGSNRTPAICFDAESLGGGWAPRDVAANIDKSGTLNCTYRKAVAHTLKGRGHDASEDGTGRGTPIVYENHGQDSRIKKVDQAPAVSAKAGTGGGNVPLVGEPSLLTMREGKPGGGKGPLVRKNKSGTLATGNNQTLFSGMAVRRLTPRECERLQGFPDDYTLIERNGKDAADGPRYKALGNSMAVPVMRWIGKRIKIVDLLLRQYSNQEGAR